MRQLRTQTALDDVSVQIHGILQDLEHLEHDIRSESKSSAGDMYETAREMISQEISRISQLLATQRKCESDLRKWLSWYSTQFDAIEYGHIVDLGSYKVFMGISFAPTPLENDAKVLGISEKTPLYRELLGKSKGQDVLLMQRTVVVQGIY